MQHAGCAYQTIVLPGGLGSVQETMNGIPGACWRVGNRCIFAIMMIMVRDMTNGLAQAEFGVKRASETDVGGV
ncbi:MAG: hypothetical protein CVU39_19695 [Chloroflexi bacterium HGW-Chloroflexi-10]|nr:MAG: hypothetical protein CVU39_19695 [Chloroflexi bacterium HGW-Chloroflexi-10]